MDIWSKKKRSEVMSRIPSKNTSPEKNIKCILSRLKLKYRVHAKELPGCPDFVFERMRKAIFVHGCFWHFHKKCCDGHIPHSNRNKWQHKLERNIQRDKENINMLKKLGWKVLTLWECEIESGKKAQSKLFKFLGKSVVPSSK